MNFDAPLDVGFTIYSKSGCDNCTKVKKLLKEKNTFFFEVVCDDYLIEDKSGFLAFIQHHANVSYKTFPMVFYNSNFVGGFLETKTYLQKLDFRIDDNF
jgi:glutaredoxin